MNIDEKKIRKILENFDIEPGDLFDRELANALAARACGLSFKRIEKMIEERLS